MPSSSGPTVYGWRWQSVPSPFRFHPKSESSNSLAPPWRLPTALCVAGPMIPRSLRTSRSGQFLREVQGSPLATFLRPACDLRYPFPQKTSESGGRVHRAADCNGSETNDTARLFAVLAPRSPSGILVKMHFAWSHAVVPCRPDGKLAHESLLPSPHPPRDGCNRVPSGSHTQHCHPVPKRQSSEVLHQPSAGVVPPTS